MKLVYKIILLMLLLVPTLVSADTIKKEVNVYSFVGRGCPHCAELEDYLNDIKDTYNLNIVYYETWYNKSNLAVMKDVEDYFNIDIKDSGAVPLTIIGNKKFQGYASYMNSEIIAAINNYVSDDSTVVSILKDAKAGKGVDTSSFITLGAVAILTVGLYFFVKPPKKKVTR